MALGDGRHRLAIKTDLQRAIAKQPGDQVTFVLEERVTLTSSACKVARFVRCEQIAQALGLHDTERWQHHIAVGKAISGEDFETGSASLRLSTNMAETSLLCRSISTSSVPRLWDLGSTTRSVGSPVSSLDGEGNHRFRTARALRPAEVDPSVMPTVGAYLSTLAGPSTLSSIEGPVAWNRWTI